MVEVYDGDLPTTRWVRISAGSGFGSREAWYEVVESILVLRDEGDHDNLAGNSVACDFEGLTAEQAYEKKNSINSEPVGHDYDGCHACNFGVSIIETNDPAEYGADFLTYEEPEEAEQLRELIRLFLSKKAGFADLKAAVEAAE